VMEKWSSKPGRGNAALLVLVPFSFFLEDGGSNCRERENAADHSQRRNNRNLDPASEEHFEGDEREQRCQPVMQIAKTVEHGSQGKVQRAQTKNSGDVRGIGDERIVGHRQNRGNGVGGKDKIRHLDGQDHRQERVLGRLEAADPLGNGGAGRFASNQTKCDIQQEKAEEPIDPAEMLQKLDTDCDEYRPQHDGAPDSPQQGGMLPLAVDPKALEQNKKNKEVIDAERGLDGVAGYKLKRWLPAVCKGHPDGKCTSRKDEKDRSDPGEKLRMARIARVAGQERVDQQQHRDTGMESHPPDPRSASNHRWMLQYETVCKKTQEQP